MVFMEKNKRVLIAIPFLMFILFLNSIVFGQSIGVVYPNGQPKILSATTSQISPQTTTITLLVQNVGSGQGNFNVQNIVCDGVQQTGLNAYPISVDAGQTGTITFSESPETKKCSGQVVDTGTGKSDSWNVSWQMAAAAQCIDGRTYNFGDAVIQDCVNGKLVARAPCQYGVTTDNSGSYVCADNPANAAGVQNTQATAYDNSGISSNTAIIVLLLVALIIYFAYRMGQKNTKKKK